MDNTHFSLGLYKQIRLVELKAFMPGIEWYVGLANDITNIPKHIKNRNSFAFYKTKNTSEIIGAFNKLLLLPQHNKCEESSPMDKNISIIYHFNNGVKKKM